MFMNVSPEVIQRLKEAGWFEGRKIDATDMIDYLEARGFKISEKVKQFLEEFGLLKIQFIDSKGRLEFHVIDPKLSVSEHQTRDKTDAVEVSEYAGEEMIPVGEISRGTLNLFVSESGRVGTGFGLYGNNAWEAWETLLGQGKASYWQQVKKG